MPARGAVRGLGRLRAGTLRRGFRFGLPFQASVLGFGSGFSIGLCGRGSSDGVATHAGALRQGFRFRLPLRASVPAFRSGSAAGAVQAVWPPAPGLSGGVGSGLPFEASDLGFASSRPLRHPVEVPSSEQATAGSAAITARFRSGLPSGLRFRLSGPAFRSGSVAGAVRAVWPTAPGFSGRACASAPVLGFGSSRPLRLRSSCHRAGKQRRAHREQARRGGTSLCLQAGRPQPDHAAVACTANTADTVRLPRRDSPAEVPLRPRVLGFVPLSVLGFRSGFRPGPPGARNLPFAVLCWARVAGAPRFPRYGMRVTVLGVERWGCG